MWGKWVTKHLPMVGMYVQVEFFRDRSSQVCTVEAFVTQVSGKVLSLSIELPPPKCHATRWREWIAPESSDIKRKVVKKQPKPFRKGVNTQK